MSTKTDAALADFLDMLADALDAQAEFETVLTDRTKERTKALRNATEQATRLNVVEMKQADADEAEADEKPKTRRKAG